jgi:hypothetical protein
MRANEPLVVHDAFDGEVMAVRNDTGTYYSMPGSAAVAWQALASGLDVDATASTLALVYGADADAIVPDVKAFVDQLLQEQLLAEGEPAEAAPAPAATPGSEVYEPPVLQAFTDMQDLLLFDPIHEVEPGGWPQVSGPDPA